MSAPKPANPQWLAGYFDCRGCIFLHTRKPKKMALRVTLSGNSILLMRVERLFPQNNGGIRTGRRRQGAYLEYNGKEAKALLKTILPFAVIKREQVELALDYIETIPETGKPVDDIDRARRAELADDLRKAKAG